MPQDLALIKRVIQQVFPPGAELASDPAQASPEQRYWVIPGKSGYPRWILPHSAKNGWPGLQFWQPYDLSSRLKWDAILKMYKMGYLGVFPHIFEIGILHNDHWTHIGKQEPVFPVIYLGEPHARGKAVTFTVEAKGRRCTEVIKFPIGHSALKKILHEAHVLEQLAHDKPGIFPRLLFVNSEKGISAQESLLVKPTPRKLGWEHINWLKSMAVSGSTTSLRLQAEQLRQRLLNFPEQLSQAKPYLERLSDDTPLTAVWAHGDFAPWNLKRQADGTLIAIDWEDGTRFSIPLYDLLHFLFIVAWSQKKPLNILPALYSNPLAMDYCQHFSLTEYQVRQIFQFFLLDYWCRRLEEEDQALSQQVWAVIHPLLEQDA